jgi:hypothetical protein
MRAAFVLSFVANLLLTAVALVTGPSRMATQFGSGGEPGSWAPAWINALIMTAVNVLLFLSLHYSPRLIRVLPARWINLPNRDYWLSEANRGRAETMLCSRLRLFGTVTFVFLFMVGLLALQANLSEPVRFREDLFWWPFGLYLVFTAGWTVNVFRAFRLPQGQERGGERDARAETRGMGGKHE